VCLRARVFVFAPAGRGFNKLIPKIVVGFIADYTMKIEITLTGPMARAATALVSLGICALAVFGIVSSFIINVLADERVEASREMLSVASDYFPSSARLHARVAQALDTSDPQYQESHAISAVNLSPYNYRYKLLLASIKESNGESSAAEQSLREALALAPNKAETHWQLANLLLREGDLDLCIKHFRAACSMNKGLLPVTFNLIWRASGEDFNAIKAVASDDPGSSLALAHFLFKQSHVEEAVSVFNQIDRGSRLSSPDGLAFLNTLISSGHLQLARSTWIQSVSEGGKDNPLIWNGGFESDVTKGPAHFDWVIGSSDYAKFRLAAGEAHTGRQSLRIDFTGHDTTRLGGEIKQLIAVRPGVRYRLDCYAKADQLITPEGPRVMVKTGAAPKWEVVSGAVAVGQSGWQRLSVEFTPPGDQAGDAPALYVTIHRKPRYSFDEPTRGTVLFDDFTLTEVKETR
jgi:tetratricopeptide (TPR) repeat protein